MSQAKHSGALVAGMALFSMFFGAGDLIWPLILGGQSGDQNFYAMLGLLVTGVTLPLLGLVAITLFGGNHREFFGRMGVMPAFLIIFVVQVILGPAGSIPRLFTLAYATLKPYMPEAIGLASFSVLASLVTLAFTLKPQKMVSILGMILTPLLLLSLCAIVGIGLWNSRIPEVSGLEPFEAFSNGITVGYNTLDVIASFMFAPLVISHFLKNTPGDTVDSRREIFIKSLKASFVAAGMLCAMYIGLTYVSSFYTPVLRPGHLPEERLSEISRVLLGETGAVISCIAVALVCLTTAMPLVSIFANYMREDLLGGRGGKIMPLIATLAISSLIANIGFMGIAKMLSPVLQILCPGLIVLSVLNICHKLFETRVPKVPVYATFAVSTLGHMI